MNNDLPDNLGPDLSAYLDGELPPERAHEIERRLRDDPAARAELEHLRAASQQLADLPRRRSPRNFRALVPHGGSPQREPAPDRARLPVALRWYAGITAAAAVLIGGLLMSWHAGEPTAPPLREARKLGEPLAGAGRADEDAINADRPVAGGVAGERGGLATGEGRVAWADLKEHTVPPAAPGAGEADALSDRSDEYLARSSFATAPSLSATTGPATAAGGALVVAAQPGGAVGGEAADELVVAQTGVPTSTINVYVEPQDAEQYAAAYALVKSHEILRTPAVEEKLGEHGATDKLAPTYREGVQLVREMPRAEVANFITELKKQVPAPVFVSTEERFGYAGRDVPATQPAQTGEEQSRFRRLEIPVDTERVQGRAEMPASAAVPGGRPAEAGKPAGSAPEKAKLEHAEGRSARPGQADADATRPESPAGRGAGRLRAPMPQRETSLDRAGNRAETKQNQAGAGGGRGGGPAAPEFATPLGPHTDRSSVDTPPELPAGRAFVRRILAGLEWVARGLPPPPDRVVVHVNILPPPAVTSQPAPAAPARP